MSQLRQPGDYHKNNRTGASTPRVHMFRAEPNQKQKINFFFKKKKKKKKTVTSKQRERTDENSYLQAVRENRQKELSPSSGREQFNTVISKQQEREQVETIVSEQ